VRGGGRGRVTVSFIAGVGSCVLFALITAVRRIGCVKLAYDTDSALAASERGGLDLDPGSLFRRPSVAEFAAELANAASGNGAGPPPIVSRQASRESQSS
jgi:hypothetical protein